MAVFEVLEMSSEIESIVLSNPVESKLWSSARSQGMMTMREDAILKAFDKKVPFSEINNLSSIMLANDEIPKIETEPAAKGESTEAK